MKKIIVSVIFGLVFFMSCDIQNFESFEIGCHLHWVVEETFIAQTKEEAIKTISADVSTLQAMVCDGDIKVINCSGKVVMLDLVLSNVTTGKPVVVKIGLDNGDIVGWVPYKYLSFYN